MAKETSIGIEYVITASIGILLDIACSKTPEMIDIYNTYVNLLLVVFPYVIKCIYVPFIVMAVIRLIIKPFYEGKVFYIVSFLYLIMSIISLSKTIPEENAVFYVIFASFGTFVCIFLHEIFNAKTDKAYSYKS